MRALGLAREEGVSLVDMAVALALSVILVGLLGSAFGAVVQTDTYTEKSSRALATLRTTVERLGKELRQANRVYSDSTARVAHIWVDRNEIGVMEPAERIRWSLCPTGDGNAELRRSYDEDLSLTTTDPECDPDDTVLITDGLIEEDSFSYRLPDGTPAASPEDAKVIRFVLSADVDVEDAEARRTLESEVELRNVRT